jgi:hypothetical protein
VFVPEGHKHNIHLVELLRSSSAVFLFLPFPALPPQLQFMSASNDRITSLIPGGKPESEYSLRLQHIWCVISEDKTSARERYLKLVDLMNRWGLADIQPGTVEGGKGIKRERLESETCQSEEVSTVGGADSLTAPEPPASTMHDIIEANRAKAMAKRLARQQEMQIFEAMQWLP